MLKLNVALTLYEFYSVHFKVFYKGGDHLGFLCFSAQKKCHPNFLFLQKKNTQGFFMTNEPTL